MVTLIPRAELRVFAEDLAHHLTTAAMYVGGTNVGDIQEHRTKWLELIRRCRDAGLFEESE